MGLCGIKFDNAYNVLFVQHSAHIKCSKGLCCDQQVNWEWTTKHLECCAEAGGGHTETGKTLWLKLGRLL